jgi:hypothetical protein
MCFLFCLHTSGYLKEKCYNFEEFTGLMESIKVDQNYANALILWQIGITFIGSFSNTRKKIDVDIVEATIKSAEEFLDLDLECPRKGRITFEEVDATTQVMRQSQENIRESLEKTMKFTRLLKGRIFIDSYRLQANLWVDNLFTKDENFQNILGGDIVPLSADEKAEKEAWIIENISSFYDLCIDKAVETEDTEEEKTSRVFIGRFHAKLGNFLEAKEAFDNVLAFYQAPYRIADHADIHFLEAKAFCENYQNQRFNDDHPEEVSMYLLRLYTYLTYIIISDILMCKSFMQMEHRIFYMTIYQ